MTSEVFTDVATVARVYGVNQATVRMWCEKKWIIGARRAGRQWRIPIAYKTGQLDINPPDDQADRKED